MQLRDILRTERAAPSPSATHAERSRARSLVVRRGALEPQLVVHMQVAVPARSTPQHNQVPPTPPARPEAAGLSLPRARFCSAVPRKQGVSSALLWRAKS
mmetsp:Transcript_51840/g.137502  ORF Transcript_51840/g.137502 Transcript_51840/m.137502 type:complete len:100 (-) Transcript_51840:6-305(-)